MQREKALAKNTAILMFGKYVLNVLVFCFFLYTQVF